MNHATMILYGYNDAPSIPWYEAPNQAMEYLCHHSHVPILYSRKQVIIPSIDLYYEKGDGEIVNIKNISDYSGLK